MPRCAPSRTQTSPRRSGGAVCGGDPLPKSPRRTYHRTGCRDGPAPRRAARLSWHHVDLQGRVVLIPDSKNGRARHIVLTRRAGTVLAALARTTGRVFPMSANAFRLAWERVRRRAGLGGPTLPRPSPRGCEPLLRDGTDHARGGLDQRPPRPAHAVQVLAPNAPASAGGDRQI